MEKKVMWIAQMKRTIKYSNDSLVDRVVETEHATKEFARQQCLEWATDIKEGGEAKRIGDDCKEKVITRLAVVERVITDEVVEIIWDLKGEGNAAI